MKPEIADDAPRNDIKNNIIITFWFCLFLMALLCAFINTDSVSFFKFLFIDMGRSSHVQYP